MFAAIFRSNTHTAPNFRVPVNVYTHECDQACLDANISAKKLIIITQKAMKNMIGYSTGYISKRQKIGLFELKASTAALPFVEQKIKGLKVRPLK